MALAGMHRDPVLQTKMIAAVWALFDAMVRDID
jgi:hypothetical protein